MASHHPSKPQCSLHQKSCVQSEKPLPPPWHVLKYSLPGSGTNLCFGSCTGSYWLWHLVEMNIFSEGCNWETGGQNSWDLRWTVPCKGAHLGFWASPTRVLWIKNIHSGADSPCLLVCDLGHQVSFFYKMGNIINRKWEFYIYQWVCVYMISGCLV